MDFIIYLIPCIMVAALLYAMILSIRIGKMDAGTDRMKKIAGYIAAGAMSFLKAEYKILAIFVVIVGALLAISADPVHSSPLITVAFVTGALLSALAGFMGMRV